MVKSAVKDVRTRPIHDVFI